MSRGSEINIVGKMRNILEKEGAYSIKVHGTPSTIGEPDILAVMPFTLNANDLVIGPFGITVAIEVKRPKHKPTAIQMDRLRRYTSKGAIAFWSCDANEIMEIIRAELIAKTKGIGYTVLQDGRPIGKVQDENRVSPESILEAENSTDDQVSTARKAADLGLVLARG